MFLRNNNNIIDIIPPDSNSSTFNMFFDDIILPYINYETDILYIPYTNPNTKQIKEWVSYLGYENITIEYKFIGKALYNMIKNNRIAILLDINNRIIDLYYLHSNNLEIDLLFLLEFDKKPYFINDDIYPIYISNLAIEEEFRDDVLDYLEQYQFIGQWKNINLSIHGINKQLSYRNQDSLHRWLLTITIDSNEF